MTPYTMQLAYGYGPLTPIYNELAREPQNFTLFHEIAAEEIHMFDILTTGYAAHCRVAP